MASDVMRVRLHLRETRVLAVALDTPSELRVEVESTVRRPRCPACGFRSARVHDTRRRKVRDLEVSGRRTTLVWRRRRFVCDNCSTRHLEDHPEFENKLTRRLSRRLVADARVMTLRAAARRHGLGWHLINGVVKAWSAALAEHRRSRRCAVLLVDETSMRKRHRYVTVIVNGDTGQTLAMVQHRNAAALSTFLMQQGHRWCKGVKVVVTDGSKAYKSAIDAHLGHARHVLDRFHVIRWFSAGLTAVRRDIQRRPEGSKPAFDPEVFRARFALLRRGDTLTDTDRARLDALLDAHPRLRAGWQALQELHGLYLADDHQGALEALGRFCDLYETGELPEIKGLDAELLALCERANPALLGTCGVGAEVASALLVAAGDNPERMRSEASFAALCGASPIEASSGPRVRHRLNRGGNRQANNALWRIATVRLRVHERSIDYAARRRAEGKTRREIIRCLKRHIAREIYRLLTDPPQVPHGESLRLQRTRRGLTIDAAAQALHTHTTRISALERGLYHNRDLAERYKRHLTQLAS